MAKLKKKSKFLGVDFGHDPLSKIDASKYFTDIGHLDPEYAELECRYHGVTRCMTAYLEKLAEIKPILMPKIRKFEKLYTFPKAFAKKADLFEIKNAFDINTKEKRSVKIFRKSELNETRLAYLKREINLLRKFDHPSIVKIHDVIEDESKIYCVIDNIRGQSLFEYILNNK